MRKRLKDTVSVASDAIEKHLHASSVSSLSVESIAMSAGSLSVETNTLFGSSIINSRLTRDGIAPYCLTCKRLITDYDCIYDVRARQWHVTASCHSERQFVVVAEQAVHSVSTLLLGQPYHVDMFPPRTDPFREAVRAAIERASHMQGKP
jgi:hypothetical protein